MFHGNWHTEGLNKITFTQTPWNMLDIEMNEHLGTVCALSFFEKGPVSQVEKQDGSCLLHATELTPSV